MSYPYTDDTLLYTLQTTGVPRILTERKDGEAVYVALSEDGNGLVEIDPSEEADNG